MESSERNTLRQLLDELTIALIADGLQQVNRQALAEHIAENELDEAGAAPSWLIDLLTAVNDRKVTGHWVDFKRGTGDDTNVFDFIRHLHEVLPIKYENNEESWLLTFPKLQLEACISLEGSCYKVSGIGDTWELEDALNE
ncbi:hypothetical protein [Paenibacillus sp. Soil750]|uniref:hypothetical protein n=1 Tax=Paenibacillus sp. Soil750 TaxID=1736398 RepID=UPI0006F3799A|nr:hypothetical protein [Paenibacillus sp. Soil750]KRE75498.1 hypothetical protein ASL11_01290 [Paenibacillus sp. Soil750]